MLRLKEIRTSKHITQTEVAERLNIARASYANIENGKRDPDTQTLMQLADFFSVTIDEICGRDRESYNKKTPTGIADGLDESLINLLVGLPDRDVQRVRDFVAGLKAAHEE